MRAFIYTGGQIHPENITEHPKADDLTVAADSGYHNAVLLGERIDILLGDFDSIGEVPHEGSFERIQVPVEKDLTDTQLAVTVALDRGAEEILLIGGLSGRLDHTLSTLAILENLDERGIHATLTDGQSRARYMHATSTLLARSGYKYLSLIAATDIVKGVTVEGCKYPLKNATLRRSMQYAVSNEITGNIALISVKKGGLYIIESKDM